MTLNRYSKAENALTHGILVENSNKKIKSYTINYENEKEALGDIKAIIHENDTR